MIEIIAGMGIGLWSALALTVIAALYAKKHDLLGDRRDRFLRGDVDSAFERIEDLEEETKGLERNISELTRRIGELIEKDVTGERGITESPSVKVPQGVVLTEEQNEVIQKLLSGKIKVME